MQTLAFTILVFVAIAAPGVVLTREPLKQCIALSFYGLLSFTRRTWHSRR